MLNNVFKPSKQIYKKIGLRRYHLATIGTAGIAGLALLGFLTLNTTDSKANPSKEDNLKNNKSYIPHARLNIPLTVPKLLADSNIRKQQKTKLFSFVVKEGDTVSSIFSRAGLFSELPLFLKNPAASKLSRTLKPKDTIRIITKNARLARIEYLSPGTKPLSFIKEGGEFKAVEVKENFEHRIFYADGNIQNSLFVDAHRAGLSDRLILQLAKIFAWDIDFALNLRQGDHFTVVYDALYSKKGVPIREGNILAAEFINQGRRFIALRYTTPDGKTGYFTPDGRSLHKAFLRTPVQFSYISSRFNLHRKHPILNRVRAHKGVDYAAPIGTPIKAAGDGKVTFSGWHGGYGRFIVLKHGLAYSTAYGHLSRFAPSIHVGATVKQGQVIGYVGKSGLATGPHLHYEFRVNGRHKNPLTVKLPSARPIDKKYLADFKSKTSPLFAQLNNYHDIQVALLKEK